MNASSQSVCFNGEFLPAGTPCLPPDDRGFRFGDGVFETIAIHHGMPYQWDLHMERLQAGLTALRIKYNIEQLFKEVKKLINRNKIKRGFLRISISRGSGSRGYRPLPDITPNCLMETLPYNAPKTDSYQLWHSNYRKPSGLHYPVHCKTAQGLNSTLAIMEADQHACDDALLLNTQGYISETTSGNLFWIQENQLHTPSLACDCLEGTTRAAIMRLWQVQEVETDIHALEKADAVFTTNCALGLMPVASLAPQDWRWNTAHPLLDELTTKLTEDIHAHCVS